MFYFDEASKIKKKLQVVIEILYALSLNTIDTR